MPAYESMNETDFENVVAYLNSLKGTQWRSTRDGSMDDCGRCWLDNLTLKQPKPAGDLRASVEGGSGARQLADVFGHYNGWRFSKLNQITTQNVKNLRVKWLLQGPTHREVRDHAAGGRRDHVPDRPENAIYALDASPGRQLWMYEHRNPRARSTAAGERIAGSPFSARRCS